MDWVQILISSLSGVLGAAVGGFATYITMSKQFKYMAEQEAKKQKRDDELYLKRKREVLYAKMYDFLMRFEKDIRIRKSSYMAEETKNLLNIIQIESIWGKKKTMDLFYNLLEELYKIPFKYIKDFEKAHNKNNKKYFNFKMISVKN